jgi:hypothetical protein
MNSCMHMGIPLQRPAQHRSYTCSSQQPQSPAASQPAHAPASCTTQKTETRCNLEVSTCPRSSGRRTGPISLGACNPGRAPCICNDRSATASSVMRESKHTHPCVHVVHIQIHIHSHTNTHTFTYKYTYACTYTYIYIQIHVQTHMHIGGVRLILAEPPN